MIHRLSLFIQHNLLAGIRCRGMEFSTKCTIINDKQDMENKIWTVKTANVHDKVIMELKLDGGLGKMNEADKQMNGLPTCNTKTSIFVLVLHPWNSATRLLSFLFGD